MNGVKNAEYDNFDNVAPNTEYINNQDCAIKNRPSELFDCFDPGKNKEHKQYDLLDDVSIFPKTNDEDELVIKHTSDDDYHTLVRSLNEKRRQFFFIMSYIQSKLKMTLSGCS